MDVWQWDLDCPLSNGEQHAVRLNIWDFGGQDIYHATHQFFLSHNALYVLVANTRRNDTDFYWWLSIVEKLGGDSPVLLLKNEMDDRVFSLDEGSLLKRFSKNLKEIVTANLATQRGLPTIKAEIRHRVRKLKHIGEKYPRLWKTVRETLEHRPEPYIAWDTYEQICLDAGLKQDSARTLMGLLHNLGVCLHFTDVPLLKKTIILKPTWATEAVYRVLDDREVQLQTGRFTLDDVCRIWQTPKKVRQSRFADCLKQHEWQPKDFARMHDELLAMMQRFELCYALPQANEYIAPSLLDKTAKSYNFPDGGLLIMYDYTGFMPSGIVGHLLVRRHEWIEQNRTLAWRYGAVLAHGGTRAEIIEDRERRELHLRLHGNGCRDMATLLMDDLETIHGRFKGLDYKVLIPCQCGRSEQQGQFSLDNLRGALMAQQAIQCNNGKKPCYQMLDAAQILNGVFTAEKMMEDAARHGMESGHRIFEQGRQQSEQQINAAGDVHIYDSIPISKKTLPARKAVVGSSRAAALKCLKTLSPAQFEELVFIYEAPESYLPSSETPQVKQVIALLKYAEQKDGDFERLLACVQDIKHP
nr:COR domain-containing protein [Candidatus Venteria ishoeyi]